MLCSKKKNMGCVCSNSVKNTVFEQNRLRKKILLKKGKIVPKKKLKIVLKKKRPPTNAVTKMKRRMFPSARVAPE